MTRELGWSPVSFNLDNYLILVDAESEPVAFVPVGSALIRTLIHTHCAQDVLQLGDNPAKFGET